MRPCCAPSAPQTPSPAPWKREQKCPSSHLPVCPFLTFRPAALPASHRTPYLSGPTPPLLPTQPGHHPHRTLVGTLDPRGSPHRHPPCQPAEMFAPPASRAPSLLPQPSSFLLKSSLVLGLPAGPLTSCPLGTPPVSTYTTTPGCF